MLLFPPGDIAANFGRVGELGDEITHAKIDI